MESNLTWNIRQASALPCCGLYPTQIGIFYVLRWRSHLGFGSDLHQSGEIYRTTDFNQFANVVRVAMREFEKARMPRRRRAA